MPTPKIPLKNGEEYEMPWRIRVELGELYQDVDDELQKMRLWCLANPRRLKTPSGVLRFITTWMSRSAKKRPAVPESVVRVSKPLDEEQLERGRAHLQSLKELLKR
jgi:hypothetical protein